MPFQAIGDKNLDAIINVRVTTEEKVRLQAESELALVSVSALVRARYFGRKVESKADFVVLNELRKLGGLLKLVHTESHGAYSKRTTTAIEMIQEYMKSLVESGRTK